MDKPVIAGISIWREKIKLVKSFKYLEGVGGDLSVRSKEDDLAASPVECADLAASNATVRVDLTVNSVERDVFEKGEEMSLLGDQGREQCDKTRRDDVDLSTTSCNKGEDLPLISGQGNMMDTSVERDKDIYAWVMCSREECNKWRYLTVKDLSMMNDDWECKDNPDKRFGECVAPEQWWDKSKAENRSVLGEQREAEGEDLTAMLDIYLSSMVEEERGEEYLSEMDATTEESFVVGVALEDILPKFILFDGCQVGLMHISKRDTEYVLLKAVRHGEERKLEDIMGQCGELESLKQTPELGQLVGVQHNGRWIRMVVEDLEEDGSICAHGVDHLSYQKRNLSELKHLPEASLGMAAQCIPARVMNIDHFRNMTNKMLKIKLRGWGEQDGVVEIEFLAENCVIDESGVDETVEEELEIEQQKLMIFEMLPKEHYDYTLINFKAQHKMSEIMFEAEIRVNVSTKEGVKNFLEDFNTSSGCTFNIQVGRQDKTQDVATAKSEFRGFRKCCLNVCSKAGKLPKEKGKNVDCPSTINFRLENSNLSNKSLKAVKEQFPLWLKINFQHNHAVHRASHLRYLSVGEETKQLFIAMFELDMTPSSALEELKKKIKLDYPESWQEQFANKSKLPGIFWVHYWFKHWLDQKVGSRDGVDAISKAEKRIMEFDRKSKEEHPLPSGQFYAKIAQTPEGETVVAVVNKFMRRVHSKIPQSGDLIFMDCTSNLDRNDLKLFNLFCPSSIGGLPVAQLITTREDTATITSALNLLKSVLPPDAFYGRGVELGPVLFMTDDCDAEHNALKNIFPVSERLLCHFHLLQAMWCWLWSAKHGVAREHKATLLHLFRCVVYARSEEDVQDCLEDLYSDPVALQYPQFQKHLIRDVLPKIDQWSLYHRLSQKLPTSNFNTTNVVESSFR